MTDTALAIDVGGTKIAVGLVDSNGVLVHNARRPTPDGDAEAIWAVAEQLIVAAVAAADGGVRGMGIAS
ncbi:MAG: ROK family protein, partial [Mycobacterium sp.]